MTTVSAADGLDALPRVDDDLIEALVESIDARGFACLPDYILAQTLSDMRAFVIEAVAGSKGEYVGFTGAGAVEGTPFAGLASSERFQALMHGIYRAGTGQDPPATGFYQVLRCLSGQSGQRHALKFHYDSYVVTALIPVAIPETGRPGDLVMLPNTRPIRRSYPINVIDKLILDNRLSQLGLRLLSRHRMLRLTRIRLVPGHLYLFWGYRSIHTNEACDPEALRATALYHYVNPHDRSRMRSGLRGTAA